MDHAQPADTAAGTKVWRAEIVPDAADDIRCDGAGVAYGATGPIPTDAGDGGGISAAVRNQGLFATARPGPSPTADLADPEETPGSRP